MGKKTNKSKNKKSQSAKQMSPTERARRPETVKSTKENQQKTWQVVARLVIVGLLVFALGGSLFFGIISSAYSLPLGVSNALEGDRIDGKPAEDYLAQTNDFPLVEAPMAALCTKDGRVLFERGIDEQVTMASTTKMMTAIVALENMELDTLIKVTLGAANTDGTDSGLEEGMSISLHDCLYALLLPSGNDAAVAIAENLSGLESRFVELMNAKAEELGMTSTHFVDASGLSVEEHFTTVRDYLVLTRYCMSNLTFREIVATSYHMVNAGGIVLELNTTDQLGLYLTDAEAIGVKTGYTDEAGYCFVGAAVLSGTELYSVVFNAPTGEQRFADTANMLEWGFRHYRTIELINTSQQVADVALLSWIDKTVPAYASSTVRTEIFDLNGTISQEITIDDIDGEASKGEVCGSIIWSQGGEVLMTSDVVATETVLAPDFWEGVGVGWERFWGGFSGSPANAETSILLKSELNIPASPTERRAA